MARLDSAESITDNSLSEDFLDGAERIGAYGGWSARRTFYLLEKGLIPAFKIGNRWIARKTRLRQHFEELENAATSRSKPTTPRSGTPKQKD